MESIGSGACAYTEAVFYNSGSMLVESFYVEINTDLGSYCFETTMLPPGMRIVLRERDGKPWKGQSVKDGIGYYKCLKYANTSQLLQERILLCERLLVIDNTYNDSIQMLDIYLKPWNRDLGMYGGDKTCKISVRNLRAGDVLEVNLSDGEYKVVYIICSK